VLIGYPLTIDRIPRPQDIGAPGTPATSLVKLYVDMTPSSNYDTLTLVVANSVMEETLQTLYELGYTFHGNFPQAANRGPGLILYLTSSTFIEYDWWEVWERQDDYWVAKDAIVHRVVQFPGSAEIQIEKPRCWDLFLDEEES